MSGMQRIIKFVRHILSGMWNIAETKQLIEKHRY